MFVRKALNITLNNKGKVTVFFCMVVGTIPSVFQTVGLWHFSFWQLRSELNFIYYTICTFYCQMQASSLR